MSLWIPKKIKGVRTYAVWAGDPVGIKEDTTRCVVAVRSGIGPMSQQCDRRRGHGPDHELCWQHAKIAARK